MSLLKITLIKKYPNLVNHCFLLILKIKKQRLYNVEKNLKKLTYNSCDLKYLGP